MPKGMKLSRKVRISVLVIIAALIAIGILILVLNYSVFKD